MTGPRVLFHVQYLLGIGHLVRAARIAAALAADGFEVTIASGGFPVAGLLPKALRVVQLPPVKAAAGFSGLVDAGGAPLGPEALAARRDRLLALFEQERPDILMIEAFPFGRRLMQFELMPLIAAARARKPPPLIVASVRDILQRPRNPARAEETAALIEQAFDLVLVHGDPRLIELETTFPLAPRIAGKTVHTGLVGPEPRAIGPDGSVEASAFAIPGGDPVPRPLPADHDVIVSVGGGAFGAELIAAAIAAKPLTTLGHRRWLVVTGPHGAAGGARGSDEAADAGISVARFLPDLAARLGTARVSVSHAGYNTVADILAAGCRAVLVPYDAGGETEQTERARLMAARGLAVMVEPARLTPAILAAAIDRAAAMPAPTEMLDLGGARNTAAILRRWLALKAEPR